MTITEQEQQAIDDKMKCFNALKEVAENAVADGLADRFDDAFVDVLVSAHLIDEPLGHPETPHRIGAMSDGVGITLDRTIGPREEDAAFFQKIRPRGPSFLMESLRF
ncbi:hypothetical protein [Crateriforma conspicua]|uniref:Uncharacterized protein n=1 Tax=Crateriforma conspicua TaxID=2527996 RepID=A0A5C6FDU1_9PLAN|nr:hypothetical protein [Crateriforma conspicua]TWU59630.1 hypothetical protein V7x_55400 [Crateriforma conspicua]